LPPEEQFRPKSDGDCDIGLGIGCSPPCSPQRIKHVVPGKFFTVAVQLVRRSPSR